MATKTATRTAPFTAAEWARLKRLARDIHTWNEDEANGAIQWEGDNEETPRRYSADRWGTYTIPGKLCKNLEEQALESARKIASKHGLSIYHQADPRGIALYVYNAADSKGRIDELYSSIGKPVC